MNEQSYPQIILASSSPRRREFLQQLQLNVTVHAADIDESIYEGELPHTLAQRLAETKARVVSATIVASTRPILVIAADTVVAIDNQCLGKPVDADEATWMLTALCGRVHQVITAVSIFECQSQCLLTRVNTTDVLMRRYSASEIAAYIASGDPYDKAGGYAIQHKEFAPVASIDGCISSVIGLPLGDLTTLLQQFGVELSTPLSPLCQRHMPFHCCQTATLC